MKFDYVPGDIIEIEYKSGYTLTGLVFGKTDDMMYFFAGDRKNGSYYYFYGYNLIDYAMPTIRKLN